MTQNRFYSSTATSTTLSGSITNVATTLTVGSVTGFPASLPYTLILERDTANEEVVTVTAAAGTTLTITRGVDGTAAVSHTTGATVEHGVSARDFNEPQAHIAATSGVHGLTGAPVGTTDNQNLTNKTLESPTLNSPSISTPALSGQPTTPFTGPTFTTISAFTNSWVAGSDTPGYAIDAAGFVVLRGTITSGVIGTIAFTLPAGFRPTANKSFSVYSDNGSGTVVVAGVVVESSGAVFVAGGNNAIIGLNNVRFKAEA